MQPRKFRILSAITAGSLAVAVVAITASSGTSQTATHTALAANNPGSFPPVNLDDCPILHTGYPQGGCVAQLQTDLRIVQDPSLDVDGLFGLVHSQTWNAVTAFQTAHGLNPDGMVGPATKKALEAALWGSAPTPKAVPATVPPSIPAQVPSTPAQVPSIPAQVPSTPAQVPSIPAQVPSTPAQVPSTPAQVSSTPAPGHCGTVQDSMNIIDHSPLGAGMREGSVNLKVYWCWDGNKITHVTDPVVWTSKTVDGALLEWNTNPPANVDKDPQNGGFWTRETVVTGTVQECITKLGCLPTQPFKLDLYVFGDGVKYIANRVNV